MDKKLIMEVKQKDNSLLELKFLFPVNTFQVTKRQYFHFSLFWYISLFTYCWCQYSSVPFQVFEIVLTLKLSLCQTRYLRLKYCLARKSIFFTHFQEIWPILQRAHWTNSVEPGNKRGRFTPNQNWACFESYLKNNQCFFEKQLLETKCLRNSKMVLTF